MRVLPPCAMGQSPVSLILVDDAYPDPDALCRAAGAATFARMSDDLYPGIRAAAPDDYASWLAQTVAAAAAGRFGAVQTMRTCFAIAIDPPAALAPIQRIPHFDMVDPDVVAAVHYLCAPPHGGTGFYRHRRTSYERIDVARKAAWRQALALDARHGLLPDEGYIDAGNAGFERIGEAELRFNRLILYPANCLHAGDIGRSRLDPSPETGRLTLTSLLRISLPV